MNSTEKVQTSVIGKTVNAGRYLGLLAKTYAETRTASTDDAQRLHPSLRLLAKRLRGTGPKDGAI